MFTISRVIFRLKFIMIAVATTVFVSGSAWAQFSEPGTQESFTTFSSPVVVDGQPAFFFGMDARSTILHRTTLPDTSSGLRNSFAFFVTITYPEFHESYGPHFGPDFPTLNGSTIKVSNQLADGRVRIQDVPLDRGRCNLDFTFCESFPNDTTADVDIVGVGEGDIFEEMFGPDLTCQLRGATTAGSITTATGLNLFGEATLAGGMSRCQGNIEL